MSFFHTGRSGSVCDDRRACTTGFTLIELVVTLAVAGIIAAMAVPAMQAMVRSGRLSSVTEEMAAAMQVARSEAIRRSAMVTVCGSSDGTTCANSTDWDRWIIAGRNNVASDASGAEVIEVIRDTMVPPDVSLTGPAAGVRFNPSGLLNAETALSVCVPTASTDENQRIVTVMISGAARTAKGTCS